MTDFFEKFISDLQATSQWEWLAVILALAYLLLAIRESLWCWPAALISTAIYMVLFFDVNLYMESILNIYYMVMAVYGWTQWYNKKPNETVKPIIRWSIKSHLLWIAALLLVVALSTYMLGQHTQQAMPLLDSFTTWFAVFTTYLVAKKVLENWFYWMVINSTSVYIYLTKGFALTTVLLLIYLVLSVYGWLSWKKHYEQQVAKPA